jgi:hypothetical protein
MSSLKMSTWQEVLLGGLDLASASSLDAAAHDARRF